MKSLGDYLIPIFIFGIVLLGIGLAILNGPDVHVKPDTIAPAESKVDARAEPDVIDQPQQQRWIKSFLNATNHAEMFYAGDLVKYDGQTVEAWLMRKYDKPVTVGGKSPYMYAIEYAQINCAMHTVANGAGAVYDLAWNKIGNFGISEATPLRNHPLDVQGTADILCSLAHKQNRSGNDGGE